MKKICILMAAILIAGAACLSFAEDTSKAANSAMPDKQMPADKEMKCGKPGMMCPMHCMMMKKTMVATSDGGVVILSGTKLLKYDKNLDLVKETELKAYNEDMQKTMMECPMCQEMGKRHGMKEEMKEQ